MIDNNDRKSIFDKPPPITTFMGIRAFIEHIKYMKKKLELSYLTTDKASFEWVECQDNTLYDKILKLEFPFNAFLGWFNSESKQTMYETIGVNLR